MFSNSDTALEMARTWLARIAGADWWHAVRDYLGGARWARRRPLTDRHSLGDFVRTRSAHIAQSALYGYLRTRAGTRYPELFANERFLESMNIAKWHVWLACVSDLSVYAGALVARNGQVNPAQVERLMQEIIDDILAETGVPSEAGAEFESHAERVRARLSCCDWGALPDDGTAFSESPAALVHWAPVVDELKRLDEEIVRNSVRFRWQEVRRDLRRDLDCESLIASARLAAAPERPAGNRG